jgi:uncharacterized repeat protein (TIGR01451 family)
MEEKWGLRKKLLFAAVIALAIIASAAEMLLAADPAKPQLSMTLVVQKQTIVRNADGKETVEWREVRESRPGDTLKYIVSYKNVGKAEARGARIVDPVPEGTAYVPGSAEGKDATVAFSIDGKNFREPEQIKYKVRDASGNETFHTATPEMYTHIQWKLGKPVPPGDAGTVSFKVKVR